MEKATFKIAMLGFVCSGYTVPHAIAAKNRSKMDELYCTNSRIAYACVLLMYCFMHFVHRMLFALMPQRAKCWDAERNRILMKWILGGVSWDSAKQKSKHTLVEFQI